MLSMRLAGAPAERWGGRKWKKKDCPIDALG